MREKKKGERVREKWRGKVDEGKNNPKDHFAKLKYKRQK